MNRRPSFLLLLIFLYISAPTGAGPAPDLDRPPRDDEVSYRPADGDSTYVNPPAFTWLPAEGVDRYIVQYSRSASFAPGQTETVREVDMTVHIPGRTLEPGTWYWRYGHEDGEQERFSRTRRFRIPASATDFPYIDIDEALTAIPEQRPRVYFTPEMVEEIRADTAGRFAHLTRPVIEQAEEILAMEEPLFEEPKPWEDYGEPLSERDGTRWWPVYVETREAFRPFLWGMQATAQAWLYTTHMTVTDPSFLALPPEKRLTFWHQFRQNYPEIDVAFEHQFTARQAEVARKKEEAKLAEARQREAEERRIAELEQRVKG